MEPAPDRLEAALRELPTQYSLALRLRAAAVTDELLCEYLNVSPEALPAMLRIAEEKLAAALAGLPDASQHDPMRPAGSR